MSALIYIHSADQTIILMDTLASDQSKQPFNLRSKIFPALHINCVFCGTGSADLVQDLFVFVQKQLVVENVDLLSKLVPGILRDLNGANSNILSTIYLFGYSPIENQMVGFAYRSKDSFSIEKLKYQMAMKPSYPKCFEIQTKGHEGLISMMECLKNTDDSEPTENQVKIGGDVHMCIIKRDEIFVQKIHRFSDCESQYSKMCDRIRKS